QSAARGGWPGPAAPAPVAMAAPGDGSVLYADGRGGIFQLRPGPEGLTLAAAYALVEDRTRFPLAPERRSPTGFYLDDLALVLRRELDTAKEGFVREARSGAVDENANERLERWADRIYAAGDATFLLEQLRSKAYGARRAAAFALAPFGYEEARPVLDEVATEKFGDGAERAKAALKMLERPHPRR
ncbi:MAG TPA: hypothetical protein VHF22_01970, partial [Planctomycetota bacterium]|nr:hypothetical protein [Planctomycetota bacterium]